MDGAKEVVGGIAGVIIAVVLMALYGLMSAIPFVIAYFIIKAIV